MALGGLADAVTAGFELGPDQAAPCAPTRVALDFWTWERLTGEGMDDEAAAGLMTGAVAAVAGVRLLPVSSDSAVGCRPDR